MSSCKSTDLGTVTGHTNPLLVNARTEVLFPRPLVVGTRPLCTRPASAVMFGLIFPVP
jgi:hypothetical protein